MRQQRDNNNDNNDENLLIRNPMILQNCNSGEVVNIIRCGPRKETELKYFVCLFISLGKILKIGAFWFLETLRRILSRAQGELYVKAHLANFKTNTILLPIFQNFGLKVVRLKQMPSNGLQRLSS
uniref:Uncharacterized protein n=1 Tax=Glossina pallidipes TaxID=7398 RepID=A0A1A9ZAK0_GLOPL